MAERGYSKKSKPRVKGQKRQGLPGSLRASKSPTAAPVFRAEPAPGRSREVPEARVAPVPVRSPEVPRTAVVPGAPTENPRTSRISSPGISVRSALVVALIVPIIYPLPDVPRHVHSGIRSSVVLDEIGNGGHYFVFQSEETVLRASITGTRDRLRAACESFR